jgi:hypothetical protein
VLNTYLVWLRFQLARGQLATGEHADEVERVRDWLGSRSEPHWRQYGAAWAGA